MTNCSPSSQEQLSMSLADAVKNINQRELVNPSLALGLAALHAQHGENDEAIKILEQLIASGIQTAEILFALAEIYESANLKEQAKENYNKAIEISSQVVVAAKARLLRIEEALGDTVAINNLRQQVVENSAELTDIQKSSELGQQVNDLVQGKNKNLFLDAAQRCGSCPGPGYTFLGWCVPCNGG